MRTPYSRELDPLQNRTIYLEEEQLIGQGYRFLGWNPEPKNIPALYNHVNLGHNYYSAFPNTFNVKIHTPSGSDATQWCTRCRLYWKVDMS